MSYVNNYSITSVIVHYKTYELTHRAIWSLHSLYDGLEIIVVENNSNDGSREKLQNLQKHVPNLKLLLSEKNLHHGPGLNKAIHSCNSEWILTFDSDCIAFRKGFIEEMISKIDNKTYAVGEMIYLDEDGFMSEETKKNYKYIHPYCALFRKEKYLSLPPFKKHGSPCLENEIEAVKKGFELKHFPAYDYVYHQWRGTAGKHGYQLGIKSKLQFLKWKAKKIINNN
ncbi:MAG: glycosyltransferase family 2 protein [Ignavibacteria bacterium]|jgi:glycosyltransferase involved in cell wall biosynthesis